MADPVMQKLSKMDDKLDDLLQWKSAMDERCTAHRERTDELHHTVYGNPDGLELSVSKLVNCKTNISRWQDFLIFILRMLVVAAIIGLFTWLLQLYKGG